MAGRTRSSDPVLWEPADLPLRKRPSKGGKKPTVFRGSPYNIAREKSDLTRSLSAPAKMSEEDKIQAVDPEGNLEDEEEELEGAVGGQTVSGEDLRQPNPFMGRGGIQRSPPPRLVVPGTGVRPPLGGFPALDPRLLGVGRGTGLGLMRLPGSAFNQVVPNPAPPHAEPLGCVCCYS